MQRPACGPPEVSHRAGLTMDVTGVASALTTGSPEHETVGCSRCCSQGGTEGTPVTADSVSIGWLIMHTARVWSSGVLRTRVSSTIAESPGSAIS